MYFLYSKNCLFEAQLANRQNIIICFLYDRSMLQILQTSFKNYLKRILFGGGKNCTDFIIKKFVIVVCHRVHTIDLLAIQQKSLDRAFFLYIFIHEIRSSGVRASITIAHIRKFYKM